MPSKARKAFDENAKDIEKLLRLHEQEGGTAKGRRFGLEVLNKSAIVLITSYWKPTVKILPQRPSNISLSTSRMPQICQLN